MLAIIGGTGIYQLEGIKILEKVKINTPFGKPSSAIIKAKYEDNFFLFLPRHGKNHQFLPHEINYAANIFALKKLGAKQVLSFSATGSLRKEIHPGEFAIASQYFDFIKGNRKKTFFGEGLAAHISTAEPVCENMTNWILKGAQSSDIKIHHHKTYAAVDGPRLGTKIESHFFRQAGCDLIGMTNVPEVFLAREAQLCYASIGIVTDYDCWLDEPNQYVSVSEVIKTYGKSLINAKKLLLKLLVLPYAKIDETYRKSLSNAILTPPKSIPINKKELLEVLSK